MLMIVFVRLCKNKQRFSLIQQLVPLKKIKLLPFMPKAVFKVLKFGLEVQ